VRSSTHASHPGQDPLYNKGTGFQHGERDRLNIRGLLPPRYLDFKTQIDRVGREAKGAGHGVGWEWVVRSIYFDDYLLGAFGGDIARIRVLFSVCVCMNSLKR